MASVKHLAGLFNSEREMELVLSELEEQGYVKDNISVLMSEQTRDRYLALKGKRKVPEGALYGGIAGGLLGSLVGALSMVGTVLSGGGLLIAGPIIGAAAGGTIGTYAGTFLGTLVGAGIPEHDAKFYENALQEEGRLLIVVHIPEDQESYVRDLFHQHGAGDIKDYLLPVG